MEEFIDLAEESASAPVYSLLKRRDEKAVTEQAYDNAYFVEDVVRNVAARLGEHPHVVWFGWKWKVLSPSIATTPSPASSEVAPRPARHE